MILRLVRPHLPAALQAFFTLILTSISIFALSQSFHLAHWVRDDAPVTTGFWLGLLFGWLLARTRWAGWFAAAYTLLLSVAFISQAMGGIVQPHGLVNTDGFWPAVDLLNLRALAFVYRANGWFWQAFNGQRVEDTGFFIFLAAILAFAASVWLIWWVARRRTGLPGVLPVGVLLAVNLYLSKQNSTFLVLFIFSSVLLLARTSLMDRYADWDGRTVDYPYDLGINWGTSAFGLALLIGLTAWLAGIVGTPGSWHKFTTWLEKARQQTSETAERLFPNVNPPADDLDAVIAETPNLSEIGIPLPRSSTTIMTVGLNDPSPPPPDAPLSVNRPPTHYWRSEIFGIYTGRGWERLPDEEIIAEIPAMIPVGRYALHQQISIQVVHGENLYAASQPVSADPDVRLVNAAEEGSTLLRGSLDDYQVTSWVPLVTASQLRSAGTEYPSGFSQVFLQLPPDLPQRVRLLAERIASSANSPYDQAIRVQNYLRENFTYDLAVDPAPAGVDVVDDFLFRTQTGFCSHFSSSMVVMLRALGIPARVVGGYAMGSFDYEAQKYLIPANAAHAWVEVYFPRYGWIELEPTAPIGSFTYLEELTPVIASVPETPNPDLPRLSGWPGIGIGVACALAALLTVLLHQPEAASSMVGPSSVLYNQIRRDLELLGVSAHPSATPQEFLRQNEADLKSWPRLGNALRSATELHEMAVYSPREPQRESYQAVVLSWRASQREYFGFAWQRLRGIFTRRLRSLR